MKKITALLSALILFITSLAFLSFADFENTHENTGDMASDIIEVARTQLGYMEGSLGGTVQGSNDCTKYGEWYGLNYQPWCAMFVSWCANQAGVPTNIIPRHASCDVGMNWFKNHENWQYSPAYGGDYTPKPSDIIYFGYKYGSEYDSTHVGIVYDVDDSKVYVIEGNSSAKVQTVSYKLEISYILGYGTPGYKVVDPNADPYPLGIYRVLASSLNVRDQPGADGSNVIAVRHAGDEEEVLKVENEYWGQIKLRDGSFGWISLKYCELVSENPGGQEPGYEIVFDANGGTGGPGTVRSDADGNITIPDERPERDGFIFDGWSNNLAAQNGDIRPGDTLTLTSDVKLYAVWKQDAYYGLALMTDIDTGAWYYKAVRFCYVNGIMAGTSESTFEPGSRLTRAMFVTMLAKAAGADLSCYDKDVSALPFTDVKSSWYTKPLKWAYENGYTSGMSADTFGTDRPITREQLALMLFRASDALGIEAQEGDPAQLDRFTDREDCSKWAVKALSWAVTNGVISGDGERLMPRDNATRAQVAQMIYRLIGDRADRPE